MSRDYANNKEKSMNVTWSDDSEEESEEDAVEENNQAFTAKVEEDEQESIEEKIKTMKSLLNNHIKNYLIKGLD